MKHFLVVAIFGFCGTSEAAVKDWVKGFITHSEMLQVARQKRQAASEMTKEAHTKFYPSIHLEGAYIEQEIPSALTGGFDVTPSQIYDAGVVVEQPIYLGGRIWAGVKQRKAQATKAESVLRKEKNQLISEFVDLLLQRQKALDTIQILQKSQKRVQDFVNATRKRARLGNARSYELSQAMASQQAYIPRIQNFQLQIRSLDIQLEGLLSMEQQPNAKTSVFIRAETMQTLIKEVSTNWEKHPEWEVIQQELVEAEAAKSMALGEHYPSLFVKGKWGYRAIERQDLGEESSRASELSVGVTIPLFSGLSSVYIRRAQQANITAVTLTREFKKKSLLAARDAANASLSSQLQQIQDVDNWRNSAEKALKEGLRNYRLGVIDNFQVVSLQQGLETAETSYIDTRYNLNQTFKTWCLAHGLDLDIVYTML